MNLIRRHPYISAILIMPVLLFAIFIAFSFYMWSDDIMDNAHAERIRAVRLTLEDVEGNNLPAIPNQSENDATVVGIDANNNLIRDDVELALFAKYPGDTLKRERAAALQYAQAEQLLFMWVIGKLSMEAYLEKGNRAFQCIGVLNRPEKGLAEMGLSDEEMNEMFRQLRRKDESIFVPIDESMKNTSLRKKISEQIYDKYMTGYSSPPEEKCDIVFSK